MKRKQRPPRQFALQADRSSGVRKKQRNLARYRARRSVMAVLGFLLFAMWLWSRGDNHHSENSVIFYLDRYAAIFAPPLLALLVVGIAYCTLEIRKLLDSHSD